MYTHNYTVKLGKTRHKMTLSEELAWRGFVNQTTLSDPALLDSQIFTIYFGVDPSADSMTIGNLASIMMVRHFQKAGHKIFMLVGGATGVIGDPDGKAEERQLKSLEQIAHNKQCIAAEFTQVIGEDSFTLVDNYDWFKDMTVLDFLRNVGKHYSMTQLLDRDFIKSRIGEGGSGISFAEFSYSLIQGYDFLHLHREHGVNMQIAGADQWGNAISGVELVRKVTGEEVHIWTTPLIMNKSTGKKFGKSEDGAIWLDPKQTSVYQFYQFWLNADDAGVIDYIKVYTLLDKSTIDELEAANTANPQERTAQKALAFEVTKIVHGEEAAASVRRISEVLFGGADYHSLQSDDFLQLTAQLPIHDIKIGDDLIEALVSTELASSNTEARRFLNDGAVYLNGQQVSADKVFSSSDVIASHAILRRGKNASAVLQVAD